jgi:Fe-S-cluster containining protein
MCWTRRLHELDKKGQRPEVSVPCNGCTSCCYHPKISVDPTREPPESLAVLQVVPDRSGSGYLLPKRADGACLHLGPQGCTVREHRPRACRLYDCRTFAMAGLHEVYGDEGHKSPFWVFQPRTEDERTALQAIQSFAAAYVTEHPGCELGDAFTYAMEKGRSYTVGAQAKLGRTPAPPRGSC